MEGDSVRTSGDNTLVDVWIDGKMRSISLSRQAIAAFLHLPPDRAEALTDEDSREFVRKHLGLVVGAAKERLQGNDANASLVTIEGEPVGTTASDASGDRRRADRRRGDRRKADLGPPTPDERRS